MTEPRITAFAEGLLGIARAEGDPSSVEEELFRFVQVVENDDELGATLVDPRLPAERRAQIVEDLLDGKVLPVTKAIVSLVVLTGKAAELGEIVREMAERSAASIGASVAEVRTAVALTDEQISRLATALTAKLGREVAVRNVVDPTVLGGAVTRIGDEVIDGTVRTKLHQLREAF